MSDQVSDQSFASNPLTRSGVPTSPSRVRGSCCLCLLVFVLSAGFWTNDCQAKQKLNDDIHVRTVNGLAQRRLYDLSIEYARSQLNHDKDRLSAEVQVDIIVAMIDSMTQKAFQSRQASDWQVAQSESDSWEGQVDTPRSILISVQDALANQAQLEQWMLEIRSDSVTTLDTGQAQDSIVEVTRLYDSLRKRINELISQATRNDVGFRPDELLKLRASLDYQRSRALMHRATLYGSDQELNRNDVLSVVDEQLKQVVQTASTEEALWWTAQADRIAVARTLGNFPAVEQILASLPTATNDSVSRDLVKAEWLRTLVTQRRFDAAEEAFGRGSFASDTPELDLARVEYMVAMSTKNAQAGWQQLALELTQSIQETHGAWWGRLASQRVVGTAIANTTGGTNLELLVRIADEAQRKKEWAEAVKALDAAVLTAKENQRLEEAWKLEFRAAAIEQEQKNHDRAAKRFSTMSSESPENPEAHRAHLLATWNLSRTIDGNIDRFAEYLTMLEHSIATWPKTESADQSRLWLAGIRHQERNWPASIGLLLSINASNPVIKNAVSQLRIVADDFATQTSVSQATRSKILETIVTRMQPLVALPVTDMPEHWTVTRQQIVLLLGELKYVDQVEVVIDLPDELDAVIASAGTDEKMNALTLRLLSVADDPSTRPADEGFFDPLNPNAGQLDMLLRGLTSENATDANSNDDLREQQRARLLDSVAARYATSIASLNPVQQKRWGRAQVNALITIDEPAKAVSLASELATTFPKDASVQVMYAEQLTLVSTTDPGQIELAITQWRRVAQRARKQSDDWFAAKYHVALLLSKQGKAEEALKLLHYLKAVPPGWKDAPNQTQFDSLLRELDQ